MFTATALFLTPAIVLMVFSTIGFVQRNNVNEYPEALCFNCLDFTTSSSNGLKGHRSCMFTMDEMVGNVTLQYPDIDVVIMSKSKIYAWNASITNPVKCYISKGVGYTTQLPMTRFIAVMLAGGMFMLTFIAVACYLHRHG